MKKQLILAAVAIAVGFVGSAQAQRDYRDAREAGDLEALHPLKCVRYDRLYEEHTAADVAYGVRACLDEEDYRAGAKLALIYTAYTNYDVKRVADSSAHRARDAMLEKVMEGIDGKHLEQLRYFTGELWDDNVAREPLCRFLRDNRPTYYPSYMIEHGRYPQRPAIDDYVDLRAEWRSTMSLVNCD